MTEDSDDTCTVPVSPEEKAEYARELEEQRRRIHERIKQKIEQKIEQKIDYRIYSVWD